MRLLHVVPSYIPAWRYGGPIRSVHGLCAGLARRGHEVHVATTNLDGDGESDVSLAAPVDIDGVAVHYFPCGSFRRIYRSASMGKFLRDSMGSWDLVHTHSVFLWPTAAAARAARIEGKPYVLSPRGMLVREMIERRSALAKRAWISLIERRNVSAAAAIHVTSAVERDRLLALGLETPRMFEIPNGVDLPASIENEKRVNDGDYILFLGRLSWKKGLDRLVESLRFAPGLKVVIAGNDDENCWPALHRRATRLGVADRIRTTGFVDGERKRDLLEGAAALVLPSYSENFGNVVLEAMGAGIPVIVTPEVGLAAVVEKTQSGIVVDGDPTKLGAALARIAADAALRERLGANGRASARAYSWDAIAERMEREYLAIVSEGGRATPDDILRA